MTLKLVDALKINAQNPPSLPQIERLNVALVCGFTPLHLQAFLSAELRMRFPAHHIEMATGLYDAIMGSLSDLRQQRFDAVALALEWPDLDARLGIRQLGEWSPGNLASIVERAQASLAHLRLLLDDVSRASPVAISLPTLPLPPLFFTAGWQASVYELRLRESLSTFAVDVARNSRARIISEQTLNALSPPSERLNVKSTWLAGFPYHTAHAATLARLLADVMQNPLPKKGLITDLDDTLWSGIVGDDGVRNISWDLDHHSQAHGLYQQFLRTLSEEGVLVGVASKNDPAVVEAAFARADLLLPRERVFPFEVGWGSKAQAVGRVLSMWNVNPESVVFVDDSPLELADVQAAHPTIECFRFPRQDGQAVYDLLVQLRNLFGRSAVSREDAIRLESLRTNVAARGAVGDSEGFPEALLEQAGAELTFDFGKDTRGARVLELVNKTNQFNLNGKRFTEVAWADSLQRGDAFLLTASYKDRFGALGKITVIAGRVVGAHIRIETWVLSCRAFARRIEHRCLRMLFDKFAAESVTFEYVETTRNTALTRFLTGMLKESPTPTVSLTAASFDAACPNLVHRVREIDGEGS